MKILLLDNSALTPVGNDFCIESKTGEFALELKNLGHEVTAFGQKVKSENTTHTFALKANGIKVKGLPRRKFKIITYILLYLRIIPELFKNDFIYVFYPTSYKWVPMLAIMLGRKYGLYIRGEDDLDDKVSYLIYKKAYVIFTVSDFFTNFVKEITRKNNVFSIKPMISFTEKDIINRKYVTIEKFKLLYLGRLTDDKGISELLHAVRILKTEYYKFELKIVGNGWFMDEAKKLIVELDIHDFVILEGAEFDLEKIKKYYTTSDIYILPSYHEGFPRTLYEAMIFGIPIITTFVGAIPAIMKDNINCKQILPKSVQSIVGSLEFAFKNYDKMLSYAEEAQTNVVKYVNSNRKSHAEHLNETLRK